MPLRIGIVGTGDVAHRHYLPAFESLADVMQITAVADPREGAGERFAGAVEAWSPGTRVHRSLEAMLAAGGLDGVFDLTPAPLHGESNRAILEAGVACYSEKPLASTVADADDLIQLAAECGVLLLCAPGSAVTNRVRWLRDLVESGRLGRPTLAVAHHADPGPAAWAEYTGDPAPFYREGVGPVFDQAIRIATPPHAPNRQRRYGRSVPKVNVEPASIPARRRTSCACRRRCSTIRGR